MAGRFLADRDRRAEAGHVVDIRLGHLAHELASVIAEAFDVSTLAFSVERIEGKRTFAAAGYPAEANQLTARKAEIDVAKIVLSGTLDRNFRRRPGHANPFLCERWRGDNAVYRSGDFRERHARRKIGPASCTVAIERIFDA